MLLDSPFLVSPDSVYYPFSNAQSSTSVMISNYLLATILYWVWLGRNRATFSNSLLNSKQIIGLIKNDVPLEYVAIVLIALGIFRLIGMCCVLWTLVGKFPPFPHCKYPFVNLSVFFCEEFSFPLFPHCKYPFVNLSSFVKSFLFPLSPIVNNPLLDICPLTFLLVWWTPTPGLVPAHC